MQILLRMNIALFLIAACTAANLYAAPFDESEQPGQRLGGYSAPTMTRDEVGTSAYFRRVPKNSPALQPSSASSV